MTLVDSMLKQGADLRAEMRGDVGGQAILYARGSTLSAAITARPGIVEREAIGAETVIYTHDTDFIFEVANAVWSQDSEAFTPQAGDRITFNGKVYDVVTIAGQQCYEESDSLGVSWRVHTVEVPA